MADAVMRIRRRRLQFRRNRIIRDRTNPYDLYDDVEFLNKYRFDRHEVLIITDEIEEQLQHSNRQGALLPVLQVLLTLRFFATGSFLEQCAEFFGVVQSTASTTIRRVTKALLTTYHHWIVFANQHKANQQKQKFMQVAGFPSVFGCIDGTHVQIQAPTRHEDQFVNRKGFHSINVQVLCDADLIFLDVVAQWPGSVHDARILRQSALFQMLEREPKTVDGFILGDSGYPLRDWLLTPVLNPHTQQEENYNIRHRATRQIVERSIGCLKRRWHCLRGLRMEPERTCDIFVACVILHNRARLLRLPDPPEEVELDGDPEENDVEEGPVAAAANVERVRHARGRAVRENLIRQFF